MCACVRADACVPVCVFRYMYMCVYIHVEARAPSQGATSSILFVFVCLFVSSKILAMQLPCQYLHLKLTLKATRSGLDYSWNTSVKVTNTFPVLKFSGCFPVHIQDEDTWRYNWRSWRGDSLTRWSYSYKSMRSWVPSSESTIKLTVVMQTSIPSASEVDMRALLGRGGQSVWLIWWASA